MTTLYVTKLFVSGLLQGLTYNDILQFESAELALNFVNKHRVKPIKPCVGKSAYIIADASFQKYWRY